MQFLWLLPSVALGFYFGLTTGTWYLAAMSCASALAWLIQSRVRMVQNLDFSQPIEIRDHQIWVGHRRLPKFRWLWKVDWNQPLIEFFRSQAVEKIAVSFEWLVRQQTFRKPGQFKICLGVDSRSELASADLIADGAHILIAGPTGSGKSKLLQLILLSMRADLQTGAIELGLVDFKGGATFSGGWLPKVAFSVNDLEPAKLQPVMTEIESELKRRETLLAKYQCSDFLQLREKHISISLLVLVCDELPELLRQSRLALQTIESVAAKGRSLGVVLIATCQSLGSIPRVIQINLRQKIALFGTDVVDKSQMGFQSLKAGQLSLESGLLGGHWLGKNNFEKSFRFPVNFTPKNSLA